MSRAALFIVLLIHAQGPPAKGIRVRWRSSSSFTLHLPGERAPFPHLHKDSDWDRATDSFMIFHDEHVSIRSEGSGGCCSSSFPDGKKPNPKPEIWGLMSVTLL